MIQIKPGVRLLGLRPEAAFGLSVAAAAFDAADSEMIVTSVCDGRHSYRSLHYKGCAFDLRSRHIPSLEAKRGIEADLQEALGGEFDVLLEGVGTANEHFHVEFDPKGGR